jgi:serine/threonine protein kinase
MGAARLQDIDSPCSREVCPSKPTLLERRQHRLKTRPSINFELVKSANVSDDITHRQSIDKLFEVHETLGQGTLAVVSRARYRTDGREVALKRMRTDDEELLNIARKEFELLRTIEHPHIIEALDFFIYPMGAVTVLSFFAGSTLEDTVAAMPDKCMPENMARRLFRYLLLAVDHLHKNGIIHRDIKASNILVSKDHSDLKLVDFNTAQRVPEGGAGGALTLTGTVDYLPPEVLLGEVPSEKSDIWATGLCLYLMLVGSLPVERRLFSSRVDFLDALCSQKVRMDDQHLQYASLLCKEVLQTCLELNPDRRGTAVGILEKNWLGGIGCQPDHAAQ